MHSLTVLLSSLTIYVAFPCNTCLLRFMDQAHRLLLPLPQSSAAPVSSPRAGGADRRGGGAAAAAAA